MPASPFQTCTLDELATVNGGDKLITDRGREPYWVDDTGAAIPRAVPGQGPTRMVSKREPLIRFGKPDHPTPLPTPYLDGNFPFIHTN